MSNFFRGGFGGQSSDPLFKLADAARQTASDATDCLCEPIEGISQALATVPDDAITQIVAWGIFNPFGPTLYTLDMIDVAATGERLLASTTLNPFAQSATAYALLPREGTTGTQALERTLIALAKRNGHPDAPVLGGSAPTYVAVPRSTVVSVEVLKDFMCELIIAAGIADVGKTAERLERFLGNPWDRATEETRAGMDAVIRQRDGREGECAPVPPSRAELDRWWRIASSPAQVQSEMSQMQAAWEGAIRLAGGG